MFKHIVSLLLVVCLVISASCITSSALYEIDDDTTVVPLMLNTGVSVAAVEPSDLDYYLEFSGSSVAKYLAYILYALTGSTSSMSSSVYTFLDSIDDQLLDQYSLLGSMSSYLSNISSNSNLIEISLDAIEYDVSDIEARLSSVISWLTSVNSSVGTVNTSVGTVNTSVLSVKSVLDVILSRVETAADVDQLDLNGSVINSLPASGIDDVVRRGFLGIAAHLRVPYNAQYLSADGNSAVNGNQSGVTFQHMVSSGFLGLRNYMQSLLFAPPGTLMLNGSGVAFDSSGFVSPYSYLNSGISGIAATIRGNEKDNIYTSILNDNNNTTTTVNSTGLGPLFNTQFSNIGENLGHLAFMFASDDDIKLKQDSQPLLDEADSFYDDSSDSKLKVSAGDVGSFKGFGSDMLDIVDTGADIGDVVTIVSNDNSFRWFTAQTAADLDSIGTATVSDEESTYDRLHREFNEIYFPDRVGGGN